ncbi:MAG: hypothetical protein KDA43_06770, partial [Hyphomonas sp.]|nr:hypothetical protein [Hyphomonas sp.]
GTGAGGSAWLADAPSYRRVPIYSSSHFRPAATAAAVGGRRAMGDTHRLDFMADTDAANGVGRGENDNRKDLPHDRDGTADAAPAADTAGAADAVAGVAAAADVDFIDAALQPLRVFLPAREPGPAATARRTVRNAMTFKEAIDAAPLDLISELRARGRRLEALVQQSPVQRALDERKRPLAQRRRGAH